jgi:ABC-type sugar transport system ATPase subunit
MSQSSLHVSSILSVEHLQKSFSHREVLQNISLQFQPGTVTAIVGDNGAGKSTFLKCLSGYYLPTSGILQLGDTEINDLSSEERRELGIEMVYQDLALAKQQDIVTNLFLGRELKKYSLFLDQKKMKFIAKEHFEKLGMEFSDLSQLVQVLSGGQQQILAIARATLFHPKVLLLDEPTAALAVREVDKVLEMIKLQKKLGRIVIIVSHRLNDIFAVADRIIVMKKGTLYSDDLVENVSLVEIVSRIVS